MTATTQVKPWDFSHVLDLVNSLSTKPDTSHDSATKSPTRSTRPATEAIEFENHNSHARNQNVSEASQNLGDFSKLWQFLGSPAELSTSAPTAPTVPTIPTAHVAFQVSTNYTSDGAIDTVLSSKRRLKAKQKSQITPLPEQSSADEADADTLSDGSIVPESPTLTKSQRKKRNRKERRAQEAALAAKKAEEKAARRTAKTTAALSEPESNNAPRSTPAKKASVHAVSTPPSQRYSLRPRDAHSKAICATEPRSFPKAVKSIEPHTPLKATDTAAPATLPKAAKLSEPKGLPKTVHSTEPYDLSQAVKSAAKTLDTVKKQKQQNSSASKAKNIAAIDMKPLQTATNGAIPAEDALLSRPQSTQTPNALTNGIATKFFPSTVQLKSTTAVKQNAGAERLPNHHLPKATTGAAGIAPIISRSGEDRHWALLLKLIGNFYEDRKHLISPMNLTTHNNDSKGIHVFVDASNIFIGFMEQLKRSRGIPLAVQIPSVDLSFDALALLMERRRPVAKRILAGSTPHLPAFDKAKAVGYECNILEKVYKARELTERQIYFKEQDRAYHERKKRAKAPPANNVATLNVGGGGNGSGSETNAPQYAPARMIEQGVDEILHLKILESVVDTDVPGTMVLATGDAARAEYSEGFMAMAERALKKGWTVELVSWSSNISQMYTRPAWTSAWAERFRVITLDDYAEELLDM